MAAGLERDPYTGKVGNLPGGIQKFIPDWLFPRKIPQAELDQAAFLNRGYKSMAEAPVDPYAPASTSATGPAPLRPLIGTPEDWNAFDQKMGVLQKEASTTGTYHAARGATGKRFNLQQRLGKAFDPYSNTR